MLSTITILTSLVVAVLYPLCFLISLRNPLKNNFHRFHLGFPSVVGGVVVLVLWNQGIPTWAAPFVITWIILLLGATCYFWHKEYPNALLVAAISIVGLVAFFMIQNILLGFDLTIATASRNYMSALAGGILCLTLFAMNLGHWYLNVHGLPIYHLMRSICILGAFLAARLLWDLFFLVRGIFIYQGDTIPLWQFVTKLDGFLLLIALFFGTLFPLIALFFAFGTLRLKNTQSTTGILYVILCSILIGDITYKYYLIKFGIVL